MVRLSTERGYGLDAVIFEIWGLLLFSLLLGSYGAVARDAGALGRVVFCCSSVRRKRPGSSSSRLEPHIIHPTQHPPTTLSTNQPSIPLHSPLTINTSFFFVFFSLPPILTTYRISYTL
jgi:hypothetical protein